MSECADLPHHQTPCAGQKHCRRRGKPAFAATGVALAKSIPVDKALHPDTLLVYEMNGAALPREHGGPVRALVPGWYGTYHVKWLTRVEAI